MSATRAKPKMVVQTDLPNRQMRSNSLEVCGDIMAVAYQTQQHGQKPAGVELFDISKPEVAALASRCSTARARIRAACISCGSSMARPCISPAAPPISRRAIPRTTSSTARSTCAIPSKPREICRWWMPGIREGDDEPPPPRHPKFDGGFRTHNTNVYPERPDRAYLAYIDGGVLILDISDKSRPKPVGHWNPHPPFPGFTHTAMPLFDRDILVVSDECVREKAGDWPKLVWILDMRREDNLVPVSTLPLPVEEHRNDGGRFGAHNMHENRPGPAFRSSTLIFGTYFNGGVRVHDITDPLQPQGGRLFRPRPAQRLAHRRGADQRRLCRRERTGLCRRPLHRRALRHRNDAVGG